MLRISFIYKIWYVERYVHIISAFQTRTVAEVYLIGAGTTDVYFNGATELAAYVYGTA